MTNDPSHPPLGRLPRLTEPQRYQGLYIVDFGDGVSVGYVAAEVATLAESKQFPQMRIYRIHRAHADGTLDLVNVPLQRFGRRSEEGMLFLREDEAAAREDFETLKNYGPGRFPCPARVQLAQLPEGDYPFVTALIYPAEYTDEVSRWLLEVNYRGGDTIEFGANKMAGFYQMRPRIVEESAIEPAPDEAARPLSELLATRQYAVQR